MENVSKTYRQMNLEFASSQRLFTNQRDTWIHLLKIILNSSSINPIKEENSGSSTRVCVNRQRRLIWGELNRIRNYRIKFIAIFPQFTDSALWIIEGPTPLSSSNISLQGNKWVACVNLVVCLIYPQSSEQARTSLCAVVPSHSSVTH